MTDSSGWHVLSPPAWHAWFGGARAWLWVGALALLALAPAVPRAARWARTLTHDTAPAAAPPAPAAAAWIAPPLEPAAESYIAGLPARIFGAGEWALPADASPPISDLDVRVQGIDLVLSEEGAVTEAYAVILDQQTGQAAVYRQGDRIRDAVLLHIAPRQVLVQRQGGQQELLRFLQPGPAVPGAAAAAMRARSAPSAPMAETGRAERIIRPVNRFRRLIVRDEALRYWDEVSSDLDLLGAYAAGFRPVLEGDRLTGYQLSETLPSDMLAATGFEPGDVMRKINSLELDSNAKVNYFFNEFLENRLHALVFEIERSGVTTNVIFTIE